MTENTNDFGPPRIGMEVRDSNGDKIGEITEVSDNALVVEKGFFFPKDYIVSVGMIESIDEDERVILTVAKETLVEDVTGESSAVDLELAGSTTFDPTIAAGAGVFPMQAGIDIETTEPSRDDR